MAKSMEWKSSSSSAKQIIHHRGSCSSRVHTCRSVPVVSILILLDQVSSSKYCTKSDFGTRPSLKSSCVMDEVSSCHRSSYTSWVGQILYFASFNFVPTCPGNKHDRYHQDLSTSSTSHETRGTRLLCTRCMHQRFWLFTKTVCCWDSIGRTKSNTSWSMRPKGFSWLHLPRFNHKLPNLAVDFLERIYEDLCAYILLERRICPWIVNLTCPDTFCGLVHSEPVCWQAVDLCNLL